MSILVVAFFLALSSAPSAASAEDKTAARDHWERGTKFYDLGKYDDAIREFEAAYEAKGDPAFLFNLSQSHRLAGHASDSLRFYRTYLRYVPKPPNRADIEDRIKELEKIVAEHPADTTAAPPAAPAGGTGQTAPPAQVGPPSTQPTPSAPMQTSPPASWPQPATSAGPGTPGGGPPGAAPEQAVPGGPGPGQAPASVPPVTQPSSGRRTMEIVLAATGGGLVVVGAIFGLVAKSQSNKVEAAANNGEAFDPAVQRLGKTSQTLQWVGYVLGGAALVTAGVLYLTAPKAAAYETPPAPRVALAPVVGPGTGGALLRLTF